MRLLLALWLALAGLAVQAQEVPAKARLYAPTLVLVQRSYWADAPEPWFLAGQVEQESCIRLTHPRCWDPLVELKTPHEYGFGLGQITTAYRKDGSVRFNKWAELRTRYATLRQWSWEQRFDPSYQLTAIVLMTRGLCHLYPEASSVTDRLGFCLSAYNGGEGGVRQDRILCSNTPGCDRARWFGHVERHSLKTRMPFNGFKKSAFEINREYPRNVLFLRRAKYEQFFRGQ